MKKLLSLALLALSTLAAADGLNVSYTGALTTKGDALALLQTKIGTAHGVLHTKFDLDVSALGGIRARDRAGVAGFGISKDFPDFIAKGIMGTIGAGVVTIASEKPTGVLFAGIRGYLN